MASGENRPKPSCSEDDVPKFIPVPCATGDFKYQQAMRLRQVKPPSEENDNEELDIPAVKKHPSEENDEEKSEVPTATASQPQTLTLLQLSQMDQIHCRTLASEDPDRLRSRMRRAIHDDEIDLDGMDLEELQYLDYSLHYRDYNIYNNMNDLDPLALEQYDRNDLDPLALEQSSETSPYPHGEQVTTECLICCEETKLNKRICCDFAACDLCLVQFIETNVNEGVVKIGCIGSCDSLMYRDEIIGRLSGTMKDKYYRFLVNANKDPKVKTCPRCSNIHHLSEEEGKGGNKYGLLVLCPECRLDWCFMCQSPWHAGIKCKDFKKGDRLVKQWAKEKHYGEINAQKCPKCKIFIQRHGGCDHMRCSECETSFCYRCGGRYLDLKYLGNHLSRYSPVGCKYNYKPNKPVLRRFVRGSVLGGKLLGGVLLLGIGVAAIGVLCGASVVIIPAFAGYKYHRHRKFKRQLKRHQEMMKMRSDDAMMELHRHLQRERDKKEAAAGTEAETVDNIEHMYRGLFDDDQLSENSPRTEMVQDSRSNPIHIGIQTGQSQQVDVTVHNPYRPDTTVNHEDTHDSEIRMNITDERGQVTVTTAEISHNTNGVDGSEAELVLHVRTSYPKPQKMKSVKDVPASDAVSDVSDTKKSDPEVKSAPGVVESVSKVNAVSEGRPKSAQPRRRVHSTGSLKKSAKKPEFGSISRKWRLKSAVAKPSNDEGDSSVLPPVHDQGHVSCLVQSDDNKHPGDQDQNIDKETLNQSKETQNQSKETQNQSNETLNQSGCFISLFGKKLNNLQNHIEKEKVHNTKSDPNLTGDKITCPDLVSCVLAAERKMEKVEIGSTNLDTISVEKDKYLGLVSTESSTTAL